MNPTEPTTTTLHLTSYLVPALLVLLTIPVAALLCWLAAIPGKRARRRGHPHAHTIAMLGWLSILIFPLWFIAMAWAMSEPEWSQAPAQLRVRVTPPRA